MNIIDRIAMKLFIFKLKAHVPLGSRSDWRALNAVQADLQRVQTERVEEVRKP